MTSCRWKSGLFLVAFSGCIQDVPFETSGSHLAPEDHPLCDLDGDGDIDVADRDAGGVPDECYTPDVIRCWDRSEQCRADGATGCAEWQAECAAGLGGGGDDDEGGGGCEDLSAELGEPGIFYSQNPNCDANGDRTIDLRDIADGTPGGCDREAINQCIEAATNCAAGEALDDSPWYSCEAQAWMCSDSAGCAGGGDGDSNGDADSDGDGDRDGDSDRDGSGDDDDDGGGGPIDPIANQRVLIGGASQAEAGGLEGLPNIDYVWWWDHVAWRAGVDQVIAHPGVVSTVGFWFCANLYRQDYIPGMGGPASGNLLPGEDWGTYTRSVEDGVDLLLANGYRVMMMTTNTTTVAQGFPEPISWPTQQNMYAWNDWVRGFAADRMGSHPGMVSLVDIAAVTSADVNGTLRTEYAAADQYHMTAAAYTDAIWPALTAGLAAVGIEADWTGLPVEPADARLRWW